MTTWLSKQKKTELQALASRAGLTYDSGTKKEELVTQIEDALKGNPTKFSDDKLFAEYFERAGSPVKKSRTTTSTEETKEVKEPKRRKTTASKPEASSPSSAPSGILASPAIRRISAAIPSSPAIGRTYNSFSRNVTKQYSSLVKKAGIKKHRDSVRSYLSHVDTINVLIALVEFSGLRRAVFPLVSEETAEIRGYGPYAYWRPNFTVFFSGVFWAPTTLWLLTSVIIPLTFAYFFNLTFTNPRPVTRRTKPNREFDPLTFAIVKGLTTWLVYSPSASFRFAGFFSKATVRVVQDFVYGGYYGMYVGSAIGVLTSLYDHISYKT